MQNYKWILSINNKDVGSIRVPHNIDYDYDERLTNTVEIKIFDIFKVANLDIIRICTNEQFKKQHNIQIKKINSNNELEEIIKFVNPFIVKTKFGIGTLAYDSLIDITIEYNNKFRYYQNNFNVLIENYFSNIENNVTEDRIKVEI